MVFEWVSLRASKAVCMGGSNTTMSSGQTRHVHVNSGLQAQGRSFLGLVCLTANCIGFKMVECQFYGLF